VYSAEDEETGIGTGSGDSQQLLRAKEGEEPPW